MTPQPIRLPPLDAEIPAARVPKWDLARLVHRACPLCGDDDSRPECVRPDALTVVRCTVCGMLYVADIPTERELHDLYEAYSSFKQLSRPKLSRVPGVARARAAFDPAIQRLAASGGIAGKKLVDIGASFGQFLLIARAAGAQVSAVELDSHARRELQRLGVPAAGHLSSVKEADIVCAFQLLEHLVDPGRLVSEVSQAVQDGGRFLIAVPNATEVALIGPTWVGFRVDLEHLNYFSVETAAELLRRHGLWVEQFWQSDQPGIGSSRSSPSLARFLENAGRRLGLIPSSRVHAGTFVLTMLARKLPARDIPAIHA